MFFCFIVDVYYINHPDEDDAINDEKYIENLVRLGEIMDEIPITHKPILAQSDAEYYSSILKASEVHKGINSFTSFSLISYCGSLKFLAISSISLSH